jgi:hypothetical protein
MLSPKRESKINSWPMLLMVLALLVGCAKELPDDVSDDIERTVHSLSLFSQKVVVESQGAGVNALTSDEMVSDIYAVNAKEHRPVKMVEGPSSLAPLFNGLQIESSQAGERFNISFKLTKGHLVAYIDTKGHNFSNHMLALESGTNSSKIPLFQYDVKGYGVLENALNSLDEVTPTIIFTEIDRAGATHVKLSHLASDRMLGGLAGFTLENPDAPVLNKRKINSKIWTADQLGEFLRDGRLRGEQLARTRVIGNNLYVLFPATESELTALESAALLSDPSDPRISRCDQQLQNALGDGYQESCVLRPIFRKSVSHVKTRLKTDEGDTLAEIELKSGVSYYRTDLVQVKLADAVVRAHLDYDYMYPNVKYILKNKLDNKLIKTSDLKDIFKQNIKLDSKVVKAVIIGRLLYLLVPMQKDQLSKVERSFLDLQNDQRIQSCDKKTVKKMKLKGDAAENCVLVAKHIFSVSHMGSVSHLGEDEIPVFLPRDHADPTTSTLLRIDLTGELRPYQVAENIVDVDDILTNIKRDFDADTEYIYVPMTLGTPREIRAARPFFQGDEKIVKIKFEKDGLSIFEVEEDERFGDNQLNSYPVMTIPGRYADFKCVEDSAKRCTGGDQMNNEISWEEKRFFMPVLERAKVKEVNSLDVFTNNSSCIHMSDVRLVDYQIESGVINFQLEKTYQVSKSIPCIVELFYDDQLNSASFKVQFSYSFVKLSDLASSDYEQVAYPLEEQRDFGFFKDKITRLNDIFDHGRADEQYLLSRWNPKKEVITYYLSDSFNNERNALLKEATYNVFEQLNSGLKSVNAGIQLELKEPAGINPGDLRYNTIVMIDDPLASGLLGYAPTVTNPRTGEIVQGHVNMYGGVLRPMTRKVYEDMVDLSEDLLNKQKEKSRVADAADAADTADTDTSEDEHGVVEHVDESGKLPEGLVAPLSKIDQQQITAELSRHSGHSGKVELTAGKVEKLTKRIHQHQESMLHQVLSPEDKGKLSEDEKRIAFYAENNAYPVELLSTKALAKVIHPEIKKIGGIYRDDQESLKRWDALTLDQQQQVVDIILPLTYVQTLTHEMGHSLGLRHNFMGSNDKANFYNAEEANALGLVGTPAYSSIMDYAASDMSGLSILGKYDLAALRFGYAREVENSAGEFVPVPNTLTQLKSEGVALKSYQFCTDENAGLSPMCARFDEGSSLKEIASFYIQKYKDDYKYLNFRNGRNSFTTFGMGGYAGYVNYFMSRARQVFEMWEIYYDMFSKGQGGPEFAEQLMNDGCSDDIRAQYPDFCNTIDDVVDANHMLGQHFLDIIKTPERQCGLAKEDQPLVIAELRPLRAIYESLDSKQYVPNSCFDPMIKAQLLSEGMIALAEGGKYLNGIKDPSPRYIYVSDIAVRGTWVDKLLAMKFLTSRFSGAGSVETGYYNLLKLNKINQQFGNLIAHLTLGAPLTDTVKFATEDGTEVDVPYQLPVTALIPEQTAGSIIEYFDLPLRHSTFLAEKLLDVAHRYNKINDPLYRDEARAYGDSFSLYRWKEYQTYSLKSGLEVTVNDMTYGSNKRNIFSYTMMEKMTAFERLPTMDDTLLGEVLLARTKPALPNGLTPEERMVIEIPSFILSQLVQVKKQGGTLTKEQLIEILGKELGAKADLAMQMEVERLEEIVTLQSQMGQAPDDASEDELYLYNLDLATLDMFVRGKLSEQLIGRYKFVLQLLPSNN